MFTDTKGFPLWTRQHMVIQQSNSSHTVVSMSGVPAVVLLPAGNHVKLINPVFLTVHVSLFTGPHTLSTV